MATYSLTRATIWNLAGYLYLIIASLISTPILISHLGFTIFTQYGLILGALSLASAIDLGLPQAVVRALVQTHHRVSRQQLWASSSYLFLITSIPIALCIGAVTYLFTHTLLLALLSGAIVIMQNLLAHYSTLPQSEAHFGYYNSRTFIVGTANTLGVAYLASRGLGLIDLISLQLAAHLITLAPLAHFSLKYFPTPWIYRANRETMSALLAFGLKNQFGKLIGQIQAQYSKYLLLAVSPVLLSAYLIAQGLIQKLAGGVTQLGIALYPRASSQANKVALKQIYQRIQLTMIVLGLVGIGLYELFGYGFLVWWLHDLILVKSVTQVLNVGVWYFLVLIVTPLPSIILDGAGKPGVPATTALLTTAIEIALAVYLLPTRGVMAPVYASLIAIVITTPILLYCTFLTLRGRNTVK